MLYRKTKIIPTKIFLWRKVVFGCVQHLYRMILWQMTWRERHTQSSCHVCGMYVLSASGPERSGEIWGHIRCLDGWGRNWDCVSVMCSRPENADRARGKLEQPWIISLTKSISVLCFVWGGITVWLRIQQQTMYLVLFHQHIKFIYGDNNKQTKLLPLCKKTAGLYHHIAKKASSKNCCHLKHINHCNSNPNIDSLVFAYLQYSTVLKVYRLRL